MVLIFNPIVNSIVKTVNIQLVKKNTEEIRKQVFFNSGQNIFKATEEAF